MITLKILPPYSVKIIRLKIYVLKYGTSPMMTKALGLSVCWFFVFSATRRTHQCISTHTL